MNRLLRDLVTRHFDAWLDGKDLDLGWWWCISFKDFRVRRDTKVHYLFEFGDCHLKGKGGGGEKTLTMPQRERSSITARVIS